MTQSLASAQLRFDVASIRPTTDRHDESLIVNPGGLIYSRVSLKDCLESAYSVKRYQISGPDWLETQLFDITARVEGNHSKDEIMLMLQTLLADRFNLALHREQNCRFMHCLLVRTAPSFTKVMVMATSAWDRLQVGLDFRGFRWRILRQGFYRDCLPLAGQFWTRRVWRVAMTLRWRSPLHRVQAPTVSRNLRLKRDFRFLRML